MSSAIPGLFHDPVSGDHRCSWCGQDPLYIAYHNQEWGMPVTGDQPLFEKLMLDGFQAGLSWITILRKRENFRIAFRQFDIDRVAKFTLRDVRRLLKDEGIIRHRGKIEAAISNARLVKVMQAESGDAALSSLLWSFAPSRSRPVLSSADIPTSSPESAAMSKELRRLGFKFVGPTIVYAFMQAVGMVNDHVNRCEAFTRCRDARLKFITPAGSGKKNAPGKGRGR